MRQSFQCQCVTTRHCHVYGLRHVVILISFYCNHLRPKSVGPVEIALVMTSHEHHNCIFLDERAAVNRNYLDETRGTKDDVIVLRYRMSRRRFPVMWPYDRHRDRAGRRPTLNWSPRDALVFLRRDCGQFHQVNTRGGRRLHVAISSRLMSSSRRNIGEMARVPNVTK